MVWWASKQGRGCYIHRFTAYLIPLYDYRRLDDTSTEFQADVVKELCRVKLREGYSIQACLPGRAPCAHVPQEQRAALTR